MWENTVNKIHFKLKFVLHLSVVLVCLNSETINLTTFNSCAIIFWVIIVTDLVIFISICVTFPVFYVSASFKLVSNWHNCQLWGEDSLKGPKQWKNECVENLQEVFHNTSVFFNSCDSQPKNIFFQVFKSETTAVV